jgi:hypothetical protein
MSLAALTLRRAIALPIALRTIALSIAVRGRMRRRLDYLEYRRGDHRNAAA